MTKSLRNRNWSLYVVLLVLFSSFEEKGGLTEEKGHA